MTQSRSFWCNCVRMYVCRKWVIFLQNHQLKNLWLLWQFLFWAKSYLFLSLGFSQASGMSSEPTSSASQQSPTSPASPSSLHLPENRRARDRSPSPMRGYLIPSPLPTRRTRTFSAWVLGNLHFIDTTKWLPLGRMIGPLPRWRELPGNSCIWKLLLYFTVISSPINSDATRLSVLIACSFSMLCLHEGYSCPVCIKDVQSLFHSLRPELYWYGKMHWDFFRTEFLVWSSASIQTLGCGCRDQFLWCFFISSTSSFGTTSLLTMSKALDHTSLRILVLSLLTPVLPSAKLHF